MKTIMLLTYAILGTYNLEVQIGDRTFIDVLSLKSVSQNGEVVGTFEVPRVFKSPFRGKISGKQIVGEFTAQEGGQSFKVVLEASLNKPCLLKGELLQEGIPFGVFSGKKEDCNE